MIDLAFGIRNYNEFAPLNPSLNNDNPIKNAKIRLKSKNIFKKIVSDEDGFFEFLDLDAGTYVIKAIKKGSKSYKQTISLEEGEEKEIEIVMKKALR